MKLNFDLIDRYLDLFVDEVENMEEKEKLLLVFIDWLYMEKCFYGLYMQEELVKEFLNKHK